jgi:hypothetical protein
MFFARGIALYGGIIFALYGLRDNGFADDKAAKDLQRLIVRKEAAALTDEDAKKAAYKQIRAQRIAAVKGDKRYKSSVTAEFQKSYAEKQWLR